MMLEVLLNSAVRLLLVGAAAWLLLRILRARNPHIEALVWRMILLAGLALPVLLYWGMAPSFTSTLELPSVISAGAAPASPVTATPGGWPAGPLASIYLAVALLLIARLAAGLVGTWRVSRAAARMAMRDDVRISARVRSPATFGSTVLLPADAQGWPAEKFDAVLEHERAHVASRDGYWSWLAQLHAAIFWFSPLAWWLERRLDALAEATSDDAVVAANHDPIAYAALLLDFARLPNSRSVVMSAAESNVSARIERLLARTPPASALPRAARWAALALLVPVVVFAASTTRAAPQPAPAAASVPAGAKAPPPVDPQARGGSLRRFPNPDDYYPAVAMHEKVSGYAVVEVDLDAIGQLVNARVVEVEPADPRFGFADAALEIARNSEFGVLNQQPATFKFKVKWLLED
jgi:beta-lactamase regulating signal transducer with metallopeptidase domain